MTILTLFYGFIRGLVQAVFRQWGGWLRATKTRGSQVWLWIVAIGFPLTVIQFVCIAALATSLTILGLVCDLYSTVTRRRSVART